jgi:hypothetical protein
MKSLVAAAGRLRGCATAIHRTRTEETPKQCHGIPRMHR